MNFIDQNQSFSVLIPDGESIFALSVLQCLAKNKNVKKYVLSNDAWSPSRFSHFSDVVICYNNKLQTKERLDLILYTVKKYNIDVVLPVDCKMIELLSEHSNMLSSITHLAVFPDTNSIKIASDKWLLAQWMYGNDVRCPETILYTANDDFRKKIAGLSFPVLIKPKGGSGGVGIKFFSEKESLLLFLQSNNCADKYIVQSFMEGYDIDCSVLCKNGQILAHTIQKGIMYSKEKVSWPGGIDFFHDEATYSVVEDMIHKMNWTGIVHIDLRYDDVLKKINIIEMNPRYWASVCASLFAGVNFPYAACLLALNKEVAKSSIKDKRVVRTGAAINIFTKRLVTKNKENLYFDNSFLEFIVSDPLPFIMKESARLFNKVFPKKNLN